MLPMRCPLCGAWMMKRGKLANGWKIECRRCCLGRVHIENHAKRRRRLLSREKWGKNYYRERLVIWD